MGEITNTSLMVAHFYSLQLNLFLHVCKGSFEYSYVY